MLSESNLTRVGTKSSEEESLLTRFGAPPTAQPGRFWAEFLIHKSVETGSVAEAPITNVNSPRIPEWTVGTAGDGANVFIRDAHQDAWWNKIPNAINEGPALVEHVKEGVADLGKEAGRFQDKLVQDRLYAFAGSKGRITYKGTGVTHINGYNSANEADTVITLRDIPLMEATLQERNAEGFPELEGKYAAVVHPDVAHDLRFSDSANDRVLAMRKRMPEQINKVLGRYCRGIVGDVVVFAIPHAQKKKSTGKGSPDVYPCYFFGKDAYGCLKPEIWAYYIAYKPSEDQPAMFSLKCMFNCKVLKGKSMQILMVQSSL